MRSWSALRWQKGSPRFSARCPPGPDAVCRYLLTPDPNLRDPIIQTTKVAHRTIKARDLDIFYREAGPEGAPAARLPEQLADVPQPDPGPGRPLPRARSILHRLRSPLDAAAGRVRLHLRQPRRGRRGIHRDAWETAQRSRFPFQQGVAMATMPENRLDRAPR